MPGLQNYHRAATLFRALSTGRPACQPLGTSIVPAAMHDLRLIRDDPAAFDAGLARRGQPAVAGMILELDERRRAVATRAQEAQARRNEASKRRSTPISAPCSGSTSRPPRR